MGRLIVAQKDNRCFRLVFEGYCFELKQSLILKSYLFEGKFPKIKRVVCLLMSR